MTKPSSLELTATAFSHWRNSRSSGNTIIPNYLREQALSLLEQYSKAQVISALKINHSALKRWQSNFASSEAGFITLPDAPVTSLDSEIFPGLKITLHHSSGTEMRISGDITPIQLQSLVQSFVAFDGRKS